MTHQQGRSLTVLSEDPGLIPGVCVGWLMTICNSYYRESDALSDPGPLATESVLTLR